MLNMSLVHKDDYFETPDWVLTRIKKYIPLNLSFDLCATESNKVSYDYISERKNLLTIIPNAFRGYPKDEFMFCNPPRSKNGKFVDYCYTLWDTENVNIVMLLCWNDLGNKYGEKLIPHILNGNIYVENLGKVKFNKDNKQSLYPSRLTYFWAWFKSKKNT